MRGRNPLINICYSGKFFELWITILRMLCLISHIVRLILAQLFLSTLIFTVLKPFLERSYHHGDAQALPPHPASAWNPLPPRLLGISYSSSKTSSDCSCLSLLSTHHHSLYLSPNECRHCILVIFVCFHTDLFRILSILQEKGLFFFFLWTSTST